MTEQLFGKDGVYNADLVARTSHGCSLSIYEARGGIYRGSGPIRASWS